MRLHALHLRDVGPFTDARLAFESPSNVTFLTGLNGSGKTVILDAIRFWFGGQYGLVERSLARAGTKGTFRIAPTFEAEGRSIDRAVERSEHMREVMTLRSQGDESVWSLPGEVLLHGAIPSFVLDYWCPPTTTVGAYEITALEVPNHRSVLQDALNGTLTRARTTQLLCHAEFLRESRNADEAALGAALYELIGRIIRGSLLAGALLDVSRVTLTPMFEQAGHRVPMSGLSAGNAYQINRLLQMLWRMYSTAVLRGDAPATMHALPGILLIDEAENHLHPAWQKRFIPLVRSLFPNVQIIATTHSPHVLASVPGARVYVCRYDADTHQCVVVDESVGYAHRSVEQILLSSAFDETEPWSDEVAALLSARERAVDAGDDKARVEINERLVAINPTAFAWLKVENKFGPLGADRR